MCKWNTDVKAEGHLADNFWALLCFSLGLNFSKSPLRLHKTQRETGPDKSPSPKHSERSFSSAAKPDLLRERKKWAADGERSLSRPSERAQWGAASVWPPCGGEERLAASFYRAAAASERRPQKGRSQQDGANGEQSLHREEPLERKEAAAAATSGHTPDIWWKKKHLGKISLFIYGCLKNMHIQSAGINMLYGSLSL